MFLQNYLNYDNEFVENKNTIPTNTVSKYNKMIILSNSLDLGAKSQSSGIELIVSRAIAK